MPLSSDEAHPTLKDLYRQIGKEPPAPASVRVPAAFPSNQGGYPATTRSPMLQYQYLTPPNCVDDDAPSFAYQPSMAPFYSGTTQSPTLVSRSPGQRPLRMFTLQQSPQPQPPMQFNAQPPHPSYPQSHLVHRSGVPPGSSESCFQNAVGVKITLPAPPRSVLVNAGSNDVPRHRDQRYRRHNRIAFGRNVSDNSEMRNQDHDRESINDSLVKEPQDQLYFSKKARPVDYVPHTIKEYREIQSDSYFQLGKLQPDLNSDELVAKREKLEKVASYSKEISEQNREYMKRRPWKPQSHAAKGPSIRDKALDFAKRIPKPPKRRPSELEDKGKDAASTREEDADSEGDNLEEPVMDSLQLLQQKHDSLAKKIESLLKDYS